MKSARKQTPISISETIPSRMAEVELLCLRIREALLAGNLSRLTFPVELLARECLINAMIHGNRNEDDKSISLRLWAGRKWMRLEVSDEGLGFAWRKARQSKLNTTATSGRGLQLYTLYAERVRFNRLGNRITLWISMKDRTRKEGL